MLRSPALASILLFVAYTASLHGQVIQPDVQRQNETFTVSGTVINAVTGEPLKRALVEIYAQKLRAVLTDADGTFQFDGLARGSYSVQARKPGFFSESEMSRGRRGNRAIMVGYGDSTATIKLFPEAVITGAITDNDGLPVGRLPVRVLRRQVDSGHGHWENAEQRTTDDTGAYRIAGLMPGTYVVSVGPRPIYNTFVDPSKNRQTGFAERFYPNTPNLASAVKINLRAGQRAEADFSVVEEPFYRVQGTYSGDVASPNFMLMSSDSEGMPSTVPLTLVEGTNRFQSDSVPPGSYMLTANGTDTTGHQVVGRVPLQVHSDVLNAHIALQPVISIPLEVEQRHLATKQNQRVAGIGPGSVGYIQLDPVERWYGNQAAQLTPNGSIPNVVPGKYRVRVTANPPWLVDSVTHGDINLLEDDLSVVPGADQNPIHIVLRDDGASLRPQLQVQTDAEGEAGTLLVIPESGTGGDIRELPMFWHGEGYVPALKPGDYALLVLDDVSQLEYRNPAVLAPYLSRATHVTLSAEQELSVKLDVVHRSSE